jgi:hypothetical protein
MAKGLSVSVVSDTREFVSGIQSGVIKPLENVEQSLEDVQREGDKAGDRLEKSFSDARGTVSDFKQQQSDLGKVLSDGSAQTRFRKNTEDAVGGAGASVKEFGSEARQNIGETFSSFRGDVTDFAQIAQDTLGGLASGLEGIPGIAAVAAGAAGIGLLINAFEQAKQREQQFQSSVGNLTDEAIKGGSTLSLHNQQVADTLEQIFTNQFTLADGTTRSLKDLRKNADLAGVSIATMARAYAGDQDAIKQVNAGLDEHNAKLREFADEAARQGGRVAQVNTSNTDSIKADLKEQQAALDDAGRAFQEYVDAQGNAVEAQQAQLQGFQDALTEAAGDSEDFYDTATKAFNTQGYIDQWTNLATEIKNAAADIATSDLTDAAKQFLENQAPQAQAEFISAYKAANPTQKAALDQIWSDMATGNAASYAAQLQGSMPSTINGPAVQLDTTAAQRQLADLRSQASKEVQLNVLVNSRRGVAIQ